jgi:hypothetical protein
MSETVYRICALLEYVLAGVPLGTNLGLLHLVFALMSGRFLRARGAVFAALTDFGLPEDAVRRAEAALCYGRWQTKTLLTNWQRVVLSEGHFVAHRYEGYTPVACDTTGFLRPHLQRHAGKHYVAEAGKAVPAVVVGLAAAVGSVGKKRLPLPRLFVRFEASDKSEADLQRRLLVQARQTLSASEVLVADAGFDLTDLLTTGAGFVLRLPKNATARRNVVAAAKGKGRPPAYGEYVRALPRTYAGQEIPATPPDETARWTEGKYTLLAQVWKGLVASNQKPGAPAFWVVALFDPRYPQPLLLATNLAVTAQTVCQLYRDRWAVEQLPLSAKPMLGAERAFVFGAESRLRLPELALLAGNLLSYVAALSAPRATGFWDRAARPTCGRLRRALGRVSFFDLPLPTGQIRKKQSVTAHLPKGVKAHRRTKASQTAQTVSNAAAFTGN